MTNVTNYHTSWLPPKLIEAAHLAHRDLSDYYLKTGEKVQVRLPTGEKQLTDVLIYCMPKKDEFKPIPEAWKDRIVKMSRANLLDTPSKAKPATTNAVKNVTDSLFNITKKYWIAGGYLRNKKFYYPSQQKNSVQVVNNSTQVNQECKTFYKSFQPKHNTTWDSLSLENQQEIEKIISTPQSIQNAYMLFFSQNPPSKTNFTSIYSQIEKNQLSQKTTEKLIPQELKKIFPQNLQKTYLRFLVAYFETFKKHYPPKSPEQQILLKNFEVEIAKRIFYAVIQEKSVKEFSQELKKWKKLFLDLKPYAQPNTDKLDKKFKLECTKYAKKVTLAIQNSLMNGEAVSFKDTPTLAYLGHVDWTRRRDYTIHINQDVFHWRALDNTSILPTATLNQNNLLYTICTTYEKVGIKTPSSSETSLHSKMKKTLERSLVEKKLSETLGTTIDGDLKKTFLTGFSLCQNELTEENLKTLLKKKQLAPKDSDQQKLLQAFQTVKDDDTLKKDINALNVILGDPNNFTDEKLQEVLKTNNLTQYTEQIKTAFRTFENTFMQILISDYCLPAVAKFYKEEELWKNPTLPNEKRLNSKTLTFFTSLAQQGILGGVLKYHEHIVSSSVSLSQKNPTTLQKCQMAYKGLEKAQVSKHDTSTGIIKASATLNDSEEKIEMTGEKDTKTGKTFLKMSAFLPSDYPKALASFEYQNAQFDLKTGELTFDLKVDSSPKDLGAV